MGNEQQGGQIVTYHADGRSASAPRTIFGNEQVYFAGDEREEGLRRQGSGLTGYREAPVRLSEVRTSEYRTYEARDGGNANALVTSTTSEGIQTLNHPPLHTNTKPIGAPDDSPGVVDAIRYFNNKRKEHKAVREARKVQEGVAKSEAVVRRDYLQGELEGLEVRNQNYAGYEGGQVVTTSTRVVEGGSGGARVYETSPVRSNRIFTESYPTSTRVVAQGGIPAAVTTTTTRVVTTENAPVATNYSTTEVTRSGLARSNRAIFDQPPAKSVPASTARIEGAYTTNQYVDYGSLTGNDRTNYATYASSSQVQGVPAVTQTVTRTVTQTTAAGGDHLYEAGKKRHLITDSNLPRAYGSSAVVVPNVYADQGDPRLASAEGRLPRQGMLQEFGTYMEQQELHRDIDQGRVKLSQTFKGDDEQILATPVDATYRLVQPPASSRIIHEPPRVTSSAHIGALNTSGVSGSNFYEDALLRRGGRTTQEVAYSEQQIEPLKKTTNIYLRGGPTVATVIDEPLSNRPLLDAPAKVQVGSGSVVVTREPTVMEKASAFLNKLTGKTEAAGSQVGGQTTVQTVTTQTASGQGGNVQGLAVTGGQGYLTQGATTTTTTYQTNDGFATQEVTVRPAAIVSKVTREDIQIAPAPQNTELVQTKQVYSEVYPGSQIQKIQKTTVVEEGYQQTGGYQSNTGLATAGGMAAAGLAGAGLAAAQTTTTTTTTRVNEFAAPQQSNLVITKTASWEMEPASVVSNRLVGRTYVPLPGSEQAIDTFGDVIGSQRFRAREALSPEKLRFGSGRMHPSSTISGIGVNLRDLGNSGVVNQPDLRNSLGYKNDPSLGVTFGLPKSGTSAARSSYGFDGQLTDSGRYSLGAQPVAVDYKTVTTQVGMMDARGQVNLPSVPANMSANLVGPQANFVGPQATIAGPTITGPNVNTGFGSKIASGVTGGVAAVGAGIGAVGAGIGAGISGLGSKLGFGSGSANVNANLPSYNANIQGPSIQAPNANLNADINAPRFGSNLNTPNLNIGGVNSGIRGDFVAPNLNTNVNAPNFNTNFGSNLRTANFDLNAPNLNTNFGGNLNAPNLNLNAPNLDTNLGGNWKAPNLDLNAPNLNTNFGGNFGSNFKAPNLDVNAPNLNAGFGSNLRAPNLDLNAPNLNTGFGSNFKGPNLDLNAPKLNTNFGGNFNAPNLDVKAPNFNTDFGGNFKAPNLNLNAPNLNTDFGGNLRAPNLDLKAPNLDVNAPTLNTGFASNLKTPNLDVNVPNLRTDLAGSWNRPNLDLNAPNLNTNFGGNLKAPNLDLNTPNLNAGFGSNLRGPNLNLNAPNLNANLNAPAVNASIPSYGAKLDAPSYSLQGPEARFSETRTVIHTDFPSAGGTMTLPSANIDAPKAGFTSNLTSGFNKLGTGIQGGVNTVGTGIGAGIAGIGAGITGLGSKLGFGAQAPSASISAPTVTAPTLTGPNVNAPFVSLDAQRPTGNFELNLPTARAGAMRAEAINIEAPTMRADFPNMNTQFNGPNVSGLNVKTGAFDTSARGANLQLAEGQTQVKLATEGLNQNFNPSDGVNLELTKKSTDQLIAEMIPPTYEADLGFQAPAIQTKRFETNVGKAIAAPRIEFDGGETGAFANLKNGVQIGSNVQAPAMVVQTERVQIDHFDGANIGGGNVGGGYHVSSNFGGIEGGNYQTGSSQVGSYHAGGIQGGNLNVNLNAGQGFTQAQQTVTTTTTQYGGDRYELGGAHASRVVQPATIQGSAQSITTTTGAQNEGGFFGKIKDKIVGSFREITHSTGATTVTGASGLKQGKGRYVEPGKFAYDGNFVNGQFHGHGSIKYQDGSIFVGEFKNGLKEGHGRFYNTMGALVKEGLWVNDQPI